MTAMRSRWPWDSNAVAAVRPPRSSSGRTQGRPSALVALSSTTRPEKCGRNGEPAGGHRGVDINVPQELSDAGRVDGGTTWQLFWRVQIPLARPAIASLTILLFLWTWNQFLLAIVLVDDPAERTMAGALGAFQGQWGTDQVLLCAGSLLILTPTLIVFLIFQRQFVKALLQGSVKG
jgi:hypothetical protein